MDLCTYLILAKIDTKIFIAFNITQKFTYINYKFILESIKIFSIKYNF